MFLKCADYCIQTRVLVCRTQPICQSYHNCYPAWKSNANGLKFMTAGIPKYLSQTLNVAKPLQWDLNPCFRLMTRLNIHLSNHLPQRCLAQKVLSAEKRFKFMMDTILSEFINHHFLYNN